MPHFWSCYPLHCRPHLHLLALAIAMDVATTMRSTTGNMGQRIIVRTGTGIMETGNGTVTPGRPESVMQSRVAHGCIIHPIMPACVPRHAARNIASMTAI